MRRLPNEPLPRDLVWQIDVEVARDQEHLREHVRQLGPEVAFELEVGASLVARLSGAAR